MSDSQHCDCRHSCDCADHTDLHVVDAWHRWDRDHAPSRLRHLRALESGASVTARSAGDAPGTVVPIFSRMPRPPRAAEGTRFPESSTIPAPEAA